MIFSDLLLTPRALCSTDSKTVLALFPLISLLSIVFYISTLEMFQNRMQLATIAWVTYLAHKAHVSNHPDNICESKFYQLSQKLKIFNNTRASTDSCMISHWFTPPAAKPLVITSRLFSLLKWGPCPRIAN